jgi:DNA-binding PadR family transcriptional regulator
MLTLAMAPHEIYRSLIRIHVLIELAKAPVDSGGLARKISDHGFTMSSESARRILRQLRARGYVVCKEVRSRRSRRLYTLTGAGRRRLRDAKNKVRALIEILGSTAVG